MLISVLIPAYRRPGQLGEALASIAVQDHALIGEILIADDSPSAEWADNQRVIEQSAVSALVRYIPNAPARGVYPNHWFLAAQARFPHLLFLHNDDLLCAGCLRWLADARDAETDQRVKLWFGTQWIIDGAGTVDPARSAVFDLHYGRQGPSAAKPIWDWCLTESIPSNAYLVESATYRAHMQGDKDGNVGDWAIAVRLANGGIWARYVGRTVSYYRVQDGSVTGTGRGVDAHRAYEHARALRVPPEREPDKRARFAGHMLVVVTRYLRDGERVNAWHALSSPYVTWRQRFSPRAAALLVMLLTPRVLWTWALRYKD